MLLSTLLPVLLALPSLAFSDKAHHEQSRSRARAHYRHAKSESELTKRASYSGRATYFAVGLGACGWNNVASDYIVALNTAQYGSGSPGPECGKSITISYGGKSVGATIADECPSCSYGDLDLSEGLFNAFADDSVGQFQMTWWYNDGSSAGTTTSQTPTSTYVAPTSTYVAPTSTYVAPTTTSTTPTSTYVAPTTSYTPSSTFTSTSTTSTSTWSSSSSSSVVSTTSSTSVSLSASASSTATTSGFGDVITSNTTDISSIIGVNATASITASADDASETSTSTTVADISLGNLILFNQAVAYMGHIVVVGAEK